MVGAFERTDTHTEESNSEYAKKNGFIWERGGQINNGRVNRPLWGEMLFETESWAQ